MNQHQAERLAEQIERYWTGHGYAVKAKAVRESEAIAGRDGSHFEWTVRTDPPLRSGLPEGARAATARTILRAFERTSSDWRKFDDDQPDEA